MSKLRIRTRTEFLTALQAVPYAGARLAAYPDVSARAEPPSDYTLWAELCYLVNEAVRAEDWPAAESLMALYDGVMRAGERGEMYHTSWVAFLEDVHLPPNDPAARRTFWQVCPLRLAADLKRDRGM